MRVNARLDDSYQAKIDFIVKAEQRCISDVIREAIDRYYAAVKAERARQLGGLDSLVGAFEGGPDTPSDLSTQAKKYADRIVAAKHSGHDHR
jgi:hypothetical protein